MRSYMELIFIDGEDLARKTDMQAARSTNAATWAAFNSYRRFAVDIKEAQFLLDYYNSKGDLADTIAITADGFTALTGRTPETEAHYCKVDRTFWDEVQKAAA